MIDINTIHLWNHHPQHFEFILNNVRSADQELYRQGLDYTEVEHQVGRYLNMRDIATEIMQQDIEGDVVEFGTYQGLGMLMLMQCFENEAQHLRNFIGIDSFEGLPESSNGWVKGSFSDTNLSQVQQSIGYHMPDNPLLQAYLIQGWFTDPTVTSDLESSTKDIAVVHFDADLGSSTLQALKIVTPWLRNRTQPVYFLFDDWGIHPDEVPVAWTQWVNETQGSLGLRIEEHSSTKLTKNFRITPQ